VELRAFIIGMALWLSWSDAELVTQRRGIIPSAQARCAL
jgi:hypothetical protein